MVTGSRDRIARKGRSTGVKVSIISGHCIIRRYPTERNDRGIGWKLECRISISPLAPFMIFSYRRRATALVMRQSKKLIIEKCGMRKRNFRISIRVSCKKVSCEICVKKFYCHSFHEFLLLEAVKHEEEEGGESRRRIRESRSQVRAADRLFVYVGW